MQPMARLLLSAFFRLEDMPELTLAKGPSMRLYTRCLSVLPNVPSLHTKLPPFYLSTFLPFTTSDPKLLGVQKNNNVILVGRKSVGQEMYQTSSNSLITGGDIRHRSSKTTHDITPAWVVERNSIYDDAGEYSLFRVWLIYRIKFKRKRRIREIGTILAHGLYCQRVGRSPGVARGTIIPYQG